MTVELVRDHIIAKFLCHDLSDPEDQPTASHADDYGDVLYFSPKWGWMVAKVDEAAEMLEEYGCICWTVTPTPPVKRENHPNVG